MVDKEVMEAVRLGTEFTIEVLVRVVVAEDLVITMERRDMEGEVEVTTLVLWVRP